MDLRPTLIDERDQVDVGHLEFVVQRRIEGFAFVIGDGKARTEFDAFGSVRYFPDGGLPQGLGIIRRGELFTSHAGMFVRVVPKEISMKKLMILALAALFSGSALAAHCPADVKKIDAAMATSPKLTDTQMSEVKQLRADGEALHKAGKHQESVDTLAKAMKILGI